MQSNEPVYVYVDEAGDRGWGPKSSPVFLLAAVVVRQSDEPALAAMLDKINAQLGRTPTNPLHWRENLRRHEQRKFVSRELAMLPATFVAAVLDKASTRGRAPGLVDHDSLYRYMIRRLFERISWYARSQRTQAMIRLAHVRRLKYDDLHAYLDLLRKRPDCRIKWESFSSRYPRIDSPSNRRALQVADLVAGCIYAAFNRDEFGAHEPEYLKAIAPRLWPGSTRKLHTYGLHIVGADRDCHNTYDWWATIAKLAGC